MPSDTLKSQLLHPQKNAILAFRGVKQSKLWLELYKNVLSLVKQNKYH